MTVSRLALPALLTGYVTIGLVLPSNYTIAGAGLLGLPVVLLGLTCLVAWALCRVHPDSGLSRRLGPLHLVLSLLTAVALLTAAVGVHRGLTPVEDDASSRQLLALLGYLGTALLVHDGLRSRRDLDGLLSAIVAVVAVVALIGIVEFLTRVHPFLGLDLPGMSRSDAGAVVRERSQLFRVYSTTQHPIEFGVLVAATLPLALHRALLAGATNWTRTAALVIGLAAPLTISRSAVLGLAVGLLVLAWDWSWRRRLNVLILIVVGVGALRGAVPGLVGTLVSLFRNAGKDPSVTGRTADYASVSELFHQRPWTGRGFGTFTPEQYLLLDNQWLVTAVESGLVGVAALLGLFVVPMSLARRVRRQGDPALRSFGQALTASFAVLGVSFATYDALSFRSTSLLLFLLCGLAGALHREVRSAALEGADVGQQSATAAAVGVGLQR